MWKLLSKQVDLGEPTSFLDVYLGCTQRQCQKQSTVDNYRTMFESRISAGGTEKLPYSENHRISSWSYDMEGHAKKCVERYCEMANRTTQQLYRVSAPFIDDHHFKEEEIKFVGELSHVCFSNCSEMLILGTNWTTWYSMFSEQTCTIDLGKYRIGMACLCMVSKVYSCPCTWMTKNAGRKQNFNPRCKKLMKLVDLGEPTPFLDHVYLGCTQRECKLNESLFWWIQKNVRIRNLHRSNWKVTWLWVISRWEILRTGKQKDRAIVQSLNSLLRRPSLQEGGTGISWRNVKSMLSKCPDMLIFSANWLTRHSMVRKQTGTSSRKMDEKSLWQKLGSFDLLPS